jgi:hypothetical protein
VAAAAAAQLDMRRHLYQRYLYRSVIIGISRLPAAAPSSRACAKENHLGIARSAKRRAFTRLCSAAHHSSPQTTNDTMP